MFAKKIENKIPNASWKKVRKSVKGWLGTVILWLFFLYNLRLYQR